MTFRIYKLADIGEAYHTSAAADQYARTKRTKGLNKKIIQFDNSTDTTKSIS